MASLVGRTLGSIEILERINHGGMATVYKGRQLRLGRDVAVKVLHPHLVCLRASSAKRWPSPAFATPISFRCLTSMPSKKKTSTT